MDEEKQQSLEVPVIDTPEPIQEVVVTLDDTSLNDLQGEISELVTTIQDSQQNDLDYQQKIDDLLDHVVSDNPQENELLEYLKEKDEQLEQKQKQQQKTDKELSLLSEEEQQEYLLEQQSLLESETQFRLQLLESINSQTQQSHNQHVEMTEQIQELIQLQIEPNDTDNIIGLYGVIIIPAIIIIYALWRIIKPFIP